MTADLKLAVILLALALVFLPRATAQITEPLPATACYSFSDTEAHVDWMSLGELQEQYVSNQATVVREGNVVRVSHEVVFADDRVRVWLPWIER